MLERTFQHLPRISEKKEQDLWSQGVETWDDFESEILRQPSLFPGYNLDPLEYALDKSRCALQSRDMDYFAKLLQPREHYRIALTVPEATAFLDIETTGLSLYYDHITLIGASIADEFYCHITGQATKKLIEFVNVAKCLVTFNGTVFDLKFIRKELPKLNLPLAHVDLRFFGRRAGLKGGQKQIELDLGISRIQEIEGMSGERAPLLWHDYRLGDQNSAKTLIEYNHADIEGMKAIFDVALERLGASQNFPLLEARGRKFSDSSSKFKFASKASTAAKNRIYVPPFKGVKGPLITLRRLGLNNRAKKLRIVGIDLTGSEARATGWCSLVGKNAVTKLISTDADLISETVAAEPDLVSIDSPLSLPRGRVSAFDDDPGRQEFGIIRESERTLMGRGVSVYPALIPSMQRLTNRGMRLAREFRERGFPVIESYPGAAQDIMNIPRKRAGLEYLKKGLKDFGIRGRFLAEPVSHDEVDAVTAAVVGIFFWVGKFEALGNDDEEYLIIPDLNVVPDTWRDRQVVGISGPIAAGKTTAGRNLEKKGFIYGRYSLVLSDLLVARGKKVNRDTLQEIGDKIHHDPGQRALCRMLVNKLPPDKNLVIDGLRWPEDHAYMVESFGPAFIHLHVDAACDLREKRYIEMGNTREDFRRAIAHPVEQNVPMLASRADKTIKNEKTQGGFQRVITNAINQIINGGGV